MVTEISYSEGHYNGIEQLSPDVFSLFPLYWFPRDVP